MTSAVAPDERIEWLDAVRAVALFGVLVVNLVTEFRVSIFQQFLGLPPASGLDGILERVVSVGFEQKAFCLFSLLFGVGLALQYDRLTAAGAPLQRLARRLAVLLVFGLIHVLLIWNGDILTEYAVAGLLVLTLLPMGLRGLAFGALAAFMLYLFGPMLLYEVPWPSAGALEAHVATANEVYANGGLTDKLRFSSRELPLILSLHLFVFPRTVALFLLGILLWRAGVLRRAHAFARPTTVFAVAGIAAGGALTMAGGAASQALAQVVLALGYGAAMIAFSQLPLGRRFVAALAPMGRMAFSNYLLQSIVFGFVFFGYGLGQFGRMGALPALVLGVSVYAAQLVFSAWWLRRYRFGPLEWLWRTLTYGAAQPMRKG